MKFKATNEASARWGTTDGAEWGLGVGCDAPGS